VRPLRENERVAPTTQASASDYLSGVAFRTGVFLEKLLADNLDAVKSLDAPLAGKRLVVCGRQAAPPGAPHAGAATV
jgi:hypothetical protein